MRHSGIALIVLGVLVVLWGFMMDTTVSSAGTYIGGELIGGGSTHNLGLMQMQMMILQTGLAMFLAGAFLYGSATRREGAEPRSVGAHGANQWTDEELEGRLHRNKKTYLILLGLVVAAVAVFAYSSWSRHDALNAPDNISGVDETMTVENLDASESQANQDAMDATNAVDNALNAAME